MKLNITIRFASAESSDGELIHRIRNFGEELHRALSGESAGHVENADNAKETIRVIVDSRRKLGRALAITKSKLDQASLAGVAIIER